MTPVPILLVTGFLGAGKTTVVNEMLARADRRIAAVVNDFGAINIDAELLAGAADGVVSLANGCICCTLEGDLLRTLAALLRREKRPEAIVIETSGVADPTDIVRNLMDPVIWRAAPLETVLCVVDATQEVGALDDALLAAQLRAADVVALSKRDLAEEVGVLRTAIAARRPGAAVVEADRGVLPLDLLFPDATPVMREAGRRAIVADRYERFFWAGEVPLALPRLQAAIARLAAKKLVRVKGFFEASGEPGRQMLLQFAGGRAVLAPYGVRPAGARLTRLVFIAELGALKSDEIDAAMRGCF